MADVFDEALRSAQSDDDDGHEIVQQIIDYFEGRLTSIEGQLLTLRRFVARNRFVDWFRALEVSLERSYADANEVVQLAEIPDIDQAWIDRRDNIQECQNYVTEHYRLALKQIMDSSNPETEMFSVSRRWTGYFTKKSVPFPRLVTPEED